LKEKKVTTQLRRIKKIKHLFYLEEEEEGERKSRLSDSLISPQTDPGKGRERPGVLLSSTEEWKKEKDRRYDREKAESVHSSVQGGGERKKKKRGKEYRFLP